MWRAILCFILVLSAANLTAVERNELTQLSVDSSSVGIGIGIGTLSLIGLQTDLKLDSHVFRLSGTYVPGATIAFSSYAVRCDYRQTLLRLDQWSFGMGFGLGWQHFLSDSLAIPHPFNEKVVMAPIMFASWNNLSMEVGPALGYFDKPSVGLALELSYRFPILPL